PAFVVGRHFRSALSALDLETDNLAAVLLGHCPLLGIAVLHFAEISQFDEAATRKRNLRLRELIGVGGVAEHADRLLGAGDLGPAASRIHIALAELEIDLRGGDALRL